MKLYKVGTIPEIGMMVVDSNDMPKEYWIRYSSSEKLAVDKFVDEKLEKIHDLRKQIHSIQKDIVVAVGLRTNNKESL